MTRYFTPVFHCGSPRQSYGELLEWVLKHGDRVSPRGLPTTEISDALLLIEDPTDCTFGAMGRRWNQRLAALDCLQLTGGFSAPEHAAEVAPNTRQFLDHGIFRGAYGPRIYSQLPAVLDKLRADSDTRQAILQIWDPAWDLYGASDDYPCTIFLQFTIRAGKLRLHTNMRSNDLWWGWCYDAGMFITLAASVANTLGLELGRYSHHATSLHIYDRDHDALGNLTTPSDLAIRLDGLAGADPQARARAVYAGTAENLTPAERWLMLHGGRHA